MAVGDKSYEKERIKCVAEKNFSFVEGFWVFFISVIFFSTTSVMEDQFYCIFHISVFSLWNLVQLHHIRKTIKEMQRSRNSTFVPFFTTFPPSATQHFAFVVTSQRVDVQSFPNSRERKRRKERMGGRSWLTAQDCYCCQTEFSFDLLLKSAVSFSCFFALVFGAPSL